MAKQTFTTGQVLTAAQMTSLQETAMGGGPATAKTASYVLVAADAGKTVAMNAAGATTITVNTGLFAAGDTVFIQNLGAGACTVTAGTATVATAGSLILPQNDAGILYFTATGAAIFYDYIQAGAVSPLTTKGDLYTFSTSDARLGVGANGTTLVADSSEATGLKWATAASGMSKVTTGSFSAVSSVDIDSVFSTSYATYFIYLSLFGSVNDADLELQYRYAGPTTETGAGYYNSFGRINTANTESGHGGSAVTQHTLNLDVGDTDRRAKIAIWINGVGQASADFPVYQGTSWDGYNTQAIGYIGGLLYTSRIYTGIRLKPSSGTITGNYAIYGLAI